MYQKILFCLLSSLFVCFIHAEEVSSSAESADVVTEEPAHERIPLQISETQKMALRLTGLFLEKYHITKKPLNNISAQVFDDFFDELDYNRLIFLASDIDDFAKYRLNLQRSLNEGDISLAFEAYDLYLRRQKRLIEEQLTWLAGEIDLQGNEEIPLFNKHKDKRWAWAESLEELQARQRLVFKDRLIRLMVSGKTEEEARDVIRKQLKSQQTYLKQVSSQDIFNFYINIIAQNYDPHTAYLSPEHSDDIDISMGLTLSGIGAVLMNKDEKIIVKEIIAGGPAYKSRELKVNDKIIGVAQGSDGEMVDIIGWRVDRAVKLIRGKKGTLVRLLLESDEGGTHELSLVRDTISLADQAAKAEIQQVERKGKTYRIGIITLPSFYSNFKHGDNEVHRSTTQDVAELIGKLQKEKIDGLIIDLRNNGGGLLSEAVSASGLFLGDGPVVQISNRGHYAKIEENDSAMLYHGILGVLINRASASASEIFAGAIQDYKRGIILGENSYGKGSVQPLFGINRLVPQFGEGLGSLKFTAEMFYRVNGDSTQMNGVSPDIVIPSLLTAEDYGAQNEKHALPASRIEPVKHRIFDENLEKKIKKLESKSNKRRKKDDIYQLYIQDLDKQIELRNLPSMSLNLEERRQHYQYWKDYNRDYRQEIDALIAEHGLAAPQKVFLDTYLKNHADDEARAAQAEKTTSVEQTGKVPEAVNAEGEGVKTRDAKTQEEQAHPETELDGAAAGEDAEADEDSEEELHRRDIQRYEALNIFFDYIDLVKNK